jgi:hypothetical protein
MTGWPGERCRVWFGLADLGILSQPVRRHRIERVRWERVLEEKSLHLPLCVSMQAFRVQVPFRFRLGTAQTNRNSMRTE